MTTPKPRPKRKPLSRDKATLHAPIRALEKERDALKSALQGLNNIYGYWWDLSDGSGITIFAPSIPKFEAAHRAATKALANAGEKT